MRLSIDDPLLDRIRRAFLLDCVAVVLVKVLRAVAAVAVAHWRQICDCMVRIDEGIGFAIVSNGDVAGLAGRRWMWQVKYPQFNDDSLQMFERGFGGYVITFLVHHLRLCSVL
jgi:hypothetical protein